jgi:hypothetical protein
MATTTATAPARQRRNRRPRPERRLAASKPVNGCFAVRITVGSERSHYYVEPLPHDFGRAAFRLVKFPNEVKDGEPGSYEVLVDGIASVCPCKGFEKHGFHLDADGNLISCRHVDSLLKLSEMGLI